MKNLYEIRGDITAIFLKRRDGGVLETLISTSDLLKADSYPNTWFAYYSKDVDGYYVQGAVMVKGKRTFIQLHRFLMDTPDGMYVDHKDHNGLNNTRDTLQNVTPTVNQQNRGASKNCKSGVKGVYWNKLKGKWDAWIGRKLLKSFTEKEDAERFVTEYRARYVHNSVEAIERGVAV